MGQYNKNSLKDVSVNILLVVVLAILLLLPGYLCYKLFIISPVSSNTQEEEKDDPVLDTQIPKVDNQDTDPNPIQGDPYTEFFPIIDGQQAYVIAPTRINDDTSPILVVYSHGSNTTVTQNTDDPFMKDLKEYGLLFTQYNYIFAASNEHGVNWGNSASLNDINNLIEWVSVNYETHPKIYMLGFSMGGLPTMNFTAKYPEKVSKVALLAPTVRISEWNQTRANTIGDIDIKIWHGTKDVNIPFSNSVNFVNGMERYGIDIKFERLDGKTHFDLDTEYMNDILVFFES